VYATDIRYRKLLLNSIRSLGKAAR